MLERPNTQEAANSKMLLLQNVISCQQCLPNMPVMYLQMVLAVDGHLTEEQIYARKQKEIPKVLRTKAHVNFSSKEVRHLKPL
jgi:hypothetical protein